MKYYFYLFLFLFLFSESASMCAHSEHRMILNISQSIFFFNFDPTGLFKGSTMNLDNPNYAGVPKSNRDYLDYPGLKADNIVDPKPINVSTFTSREHSPNQINHRISAQFFDQSIVNNHNRPERPKTLGTTGGPVVRKSVTMESNQVVIPMAVNHTRAKPEPGDTNNDGEQSNNFASKQANNSSAAVLSPFDEQEEWAKISEIMAAFGTDLLADGSKKGAKPNRKIRGSISSIKSLNSPLNPPPTPLSLLVDWLYDNELEELERILVNHGYDDYYFIVSQN